jgi:hypothetical protein
MNKLPSKSNRIQNFKLPDWAIGLIVLGVLIVLVCVLAVFMSQYWCEPCKVIKFIGG